MTLEQQVCNLELSKKLRELGVKQESLFSWCDCDVSGQYQVVHSEPADQKRRYSAFTVAELGEMLPRVAYFSQLNETIGMRTEKLPDNSWFCEYRGTYEPFSKDHKYGIVSERFTAATEADARAKMLIYLLENKLITL